MIRKIIEKIQENNNIRKEKKKWPELEWYEAASKVKKCTFRVYTDQGMGTCFLLSLANPEKNVHYGMFATAWHVLKNTQDAKSIKLVSADKKTTLDDRNSIINFERLREETYDTAIIIVKTDKPITDDTDLLPLPPKEIMLAQGAEIAWMGFPGFVEPELCFFHGYISGYIDNPSRYLVDGVAINGVSGGPAFDKQAQLSGLVSAYLPNKRDQNTTLPGVSMLVPINIIRAFMEKLPNSIMM